MINFNDKGKVLLEKLKQDSLNTESLTDFLQLKILFYNKYTKENPQKPQFKDECVDGVYFSIYDQLQRKKSVNYGKIFNAYTKNTWLYLSSKEITNHLNFILFESDNLSKQDVEDYLNILYIHKEIIFNLNKRHVVGILNLRLKIGNFETYVDIDDFVSLLRNIKDREYFKNLDLGNLPIDIKKELLLDLI